MTPSTSGSTSGSEARMGSKFAKNVIFLFSSVLKISAFWFQNRVPWPKKHKYTSFWQLWRHRWRHNGASKSMFKSIYFRQFVRYLNCDCRIRFIGPNYIKPRYSDVDDVINDVITEPQRSDVSESIVSSILRIFQIWFQIRIPWPKLHIYTSF